MNLFKVPIEATTEPDTSTLRQILTGVLVRIDLDFHTFVVGDIASLLIHTQHGILPTGTVVQRIVDHQAGHTDTNGRPLALVGRTQLGTGDHKIRSHVGVGLRRSVVPIVRHVLGGTGVQQIAEDRVEGLFGDLLGSPELQQLFGAATSRTQVRVVELNDILVEVVQVLEVILERMHIHRTGASVVLVEYIGDQGAHLVTDGLVQRARVHVCDTGGTRVVYQSEPIHLDLVFLLGIRVTTDAHGVRIAVLTTPDGTNVEQRDGVVASHIIGSELGLHVGIFKNGSIVERTIGQCRLTGIGGREFDLHAVHASLLILIIQNLAPTEMRQNDHVCIAGIVRQNTTEPHVGAAIEQCIGLQRRLTILLEITLPEDRDLCIEVTQFDKGIVDTLVSTGDDNRGKRKILSFGRSCNSFIVLCIVVDDCMYVRLCIVWYDLIDIGHIRYTPFLLDFKIYKVVASLIKVFISQDFYVNPAYLISNG